MCGSLKPLLSNIKMTECKIFIVDKLIEDGIIRFYVKYFHDDLLVIKRTDISCVLNKFSSFDYNLKVTLDSFENCFPSFLNIEICPNGLGIYHKHTQTRHYVNFDSFTLWKQKLSWIRSLVTRAKRICSENYLVKEIHIFKNQAAWNGYKKHIVNSIVKRTLRDKGSNNITDETTTDTVKIFVVLKFSGDTADRIVKSCVKKLYKCFKKEVTVKLVLHYQTTKLCNFTNVKDKTPFLSQSSVVYKFVGPGCKSCYVGKTNGTLHERTKQHAYAKGNRSFLLRYLISCISNPGFRGFKCGTQFVDYSAQADLYDSTSIFS